MKRSFVFFWPALLAGALCLCSCLGSSAEIILQAGGGGRLKLEYRVSRQFQNIGALDGNARWPSVPAGRADFERSVDSLEGLRLISFSAGEEGPDLLYRAEIGFSALEDILPLLDYGGEAASLVRGERRSLVLRLGPGPETADPGLLALAEEAFRGYHIALSLISPSPVELRVRGGDSLRIEQEGGKAGFSVPLYDLILLPGPVTAEFVF
ncbi:MAG: hypothetical protein LBH26_07400 [Treponema sp.]|jgi:hypothetical protein|nr:hypothetical protein [Treponema sp.]